MSKQKVSVKEIYEHDVITYLEMQKVKYDELKVQRVLAKLNGAR